MATYITPERIKSFIGSDCTASDAMVLADLSEALFNRLVWSENGLLLGNKTDFFDRNDFTPVKIGKLFYLRNYKPITITNINGVSAGTVNIDYTLDGRRLELKNAVCIPDVFPHRIKIEYTAWLATIPDDIKNSCLFLAKGMFQKKKYGDISGYKQDLLSVSFTTGKSFIDTICDLSDSGFINLIVNKYRITYFHVI